MPREAPIRIAHLIPGLQVGGAELLLERLIGALDRTQFSSRVVSMTAVGPVGRTLTERGTSVDALGMHRAVPDPRGLTRLVGMLRRHRIEVVHSWLYHADLLAAAAHLLGRLPVIWSIHMTSLEARETKLKTRLAARACAALARWVPRAIVCSSVSAAQAHERLGYPRDSMAVVPNGADTEVFAPNAEARARVRAELGVTDDTPLIGMAARFAPQKDHRTFLRAAARLVRERPEVRFLLCGDGMSDRNRTLARWLVEEDLAGRVELLGLRDDMPALHAALDVATLCSSWGETAPLVVSEAMACETVCVTTAVGDMQRMVGDTGLTVAPRDPPALAAAWRQILDEPATKRQSRGRAARQRIAEAYSLRGMAESYAAVYRRVVDAA